MDFLEKKQNNNRKINMKLWLRGIQDITGINHSSREVLYISGTDFYFHFQFLVVKFLNFSVIKTKRIRLKNFRHIY